MTACFITGCPAHQGPCYYTEHNKPCMDPDYRDEWLQDKYKQVKVRILAKTILTRVCPHCGRTWKGPQTMFANGKHWAVERHIKSCGPATPKDRRRLARNAVSRWKKSPPQLEITVNWEHAGMQGE